MEAAVIVLLVCSTSIAHGLLQDLPCFIPTGTDYRKSVFSLATYSERSLFDDVSAVFDANWKFLPGTRVFHDITVLVACSSDIYGDAVHQSHRRTCRNGNWSPALPDCSANASCGPLHINVTEAVPATPVSTGLTFPHGSVIEFGCREHYAIMGNNSVVCKDGNWTIPRFYCMPTYCSSPYLPGVLMTSEKLGDGRYPNEFISEYRCKIGWILTGSGFLVCRERQWVDSTDQVSACERYQAVGLDVTNVTAEASDGSDVLVTWRLDSDVSRGNIQYFRILYTNDTLSPPEDWEWELVSGDSNSATLELLTPKELYVVAVVAGDGIGEGSMSEREYVYVPESREPVDTDDYETETYYDGYSDYSEDYQENQSTAPPQNADNPSTTAGVNTPSETASTNNQSTASDADNQPAASDADNQPADSEANNPSTDVDNQSAASDVDNPSTDADNQSAASGADKHPAVTDADNQSTTATVNSQSSVSGANNQATTSDVENQPDGDDTQADGSSTDNNSTVTDADDQSTDIDIDYQSTEIDKVDNPSSAEDESDQLAMNDGDNQSTAEYFDNPSTEADEDYEYGAESDDYDSRATTTESTDADAESMTASNNPSVEVDVNDQSTTTHPTDRPTTLGPRDCMPFVFQNAVSSRTNSHAGDSVETHGGRQNQSIPLGTDNGQAQSVPHGTTLTYKCAQNTILVGNSTMTCNDGSWETSNFTCRAGRSCEELRIPRGQPDPMLQSYDHGSVADIYCKRKPDKLIRRGSFTCNDGEWVGNKFACLAKRRVFVWSLVRRRVTRRSCEELRIPRGQSYPLLQSYDHGSVADIYCKRKPDKLVRRGSFTCNDGEWVGNKFACLAKRRVFG